MKKLLFSTGLIVTGCLLFYACKKNLHDPAEQQRSSGASSKALAAACTYETLSGNISANKVLSAAIVYRLDGCVTVKPGVTLSIPAGTLLLGMKTPTAGGKSFLIVERGGVLNISGTAASPVVFTSDQPAASRNPGDWGGVRLFGKANNNNSNSLSTDLGCAVYTGGGTINTDNSGTMRYFQVHFAGAAANGNDNSKAAIMLNSVGSGTTFDHVQITSPQFDGLNVAGGTVKIDNVTSYNTDRTDFAISYGNTSNMQFLTAMRLSAPLVPTSGAYGFDISNQPVTISTSTPLTKPLISNATVLGPNYCSGSPVNGNYLYAVRFFNNGAGKIYNSLFSSWNGKGLRIDGGSSPSSITQTLSGNLEFSYNSFHNSGAIPYSSTSWAGGCDLSMQKWIDGTGTSACVEDGNQFSVTTLGYNASFCSNFCGGFTQNFVLGSTSMDSPDYSWDAGGAFSHVNYRGSIGAADWMQGWTAWCAKDQQYCN
ncbi:hypothetical protein SAMN04488128_103718 [Chitinophaga eiseniae]|uniref:Uncharacterized protein n=1 Tax=Chitinophaga eiseniae TaxID=634771 RepID=A0A1T4SX61_9BACT|nr:hypothetical protein [Chitinophaga eiseniae]SKA32783.1 hypothetical protein SAMN04488128_103718 [Chitinophaga eiseniae]